MEKMSYRFEAQYCNESRSLDMSEYEEIHNEWQRIYAKEIRKTGVISVLLFCAGLWAVYVDATFMAVLLLVLAAHYQLDSKNGSVLHAIMNQNKLLAMLINKQSRDMQSLRRKIRDKDEK